MSTGPGGPSLPSCPDLAVSVHPDGSGTRVRLRGELDLATAGLLVPVVEQVLHTDRDDLVLDVSELTFCDACGLAALVTARRRLAENARQLTLTGAQPRLRQLLDITHLEDLLEVRQ